MKDELDPEVFGELPPVETEENPPIQEEVQPQYPVNQTLSSGPDRVTYLCFDPYREGGQVVQKLMSERVSHQFPDLVEYNFSRLQGLVHPALAWVRDFGWEGGRAFLVREWVQGAPLSQVLNKLRVEEVLGIIRQLLQTLHYLFSRNIFHLHLKPENLLVVSEGKETPLLKVTDFGLDEATHRVVPGRQSRVGTPPFTAPDYAIHPVPDLRADLYSVGVLCYWALSRQLPYSGKDAKKILEAQQMAEPRPLAKTIQIPEKISQWVQGLIQPSAKDRPSDIGEVYRGFLAATEGWALRGAHFPPLIYSDPNQIFRRKTALKTFRRMIQQGRRFAVQGSAGMGKGFFARWLQRYFWANQKRALLYDGRNLAQIKGEVPDPNELFFILIENADEAPVAAWLETKPFPNVIVLGKDLTWAKKNPEWQFLTLENLDETTLREILQETFQKISESTAQAFGKNIQGQPGELVSQTRVLAQQGSIRGKENHWVMQEDAVERALTGASGGTGSPVLSLIDNDLRPVMNLLAMVQVPLNIATLADWLDRDGDALRSTLLESAYQEIVSRRLWWGQEYFQSRIDLPLGLPLGVSEDEVQAWVLGLEQLGWYGPARDLMERAFPPDKLQRNSEMILTRCRLAGLTGDHTIVLQMMTASFVGQLSVEQQGPAFEMLGRAQMATGYAVQAEAAYKKAFAQYRDGGDKAGQVQVLMDLGEWYGSKGDNERTLKFFDQALAFAKNLPDSSPLLGQVYLGIGNFYQGVTDFTHAEENYLKSMDVLIQNRHYPSLGKVYKDFAELWVRQGEFQQAEFYAREALFIANFRGLAEIQGAVYYLLSLIEEHKGNPSGVLERLSEAVEVLARREKNPIYGEALIQRGNFYEKNRQLERAQQEASKILALGHQTRNNLIKAQGHMIRGKVIRRDLKRLEEAFNEFRMAREMLSEGCNVSFTWECDYEMGEIERNRGNSPKARTLYQLALNDLSRYVNSLPKRVQEQFLKDGKREQIEMALRWLR